MGIRVRLCIRFRGEERVFDEMRSITDRSSFR
jgi:hypothetical protein